MQSRVLKRPNKRVISKYIFVILMLIWPLFQFAVSGGLKAWVPAILKETFGLEDWLSIFLSVFLPFCSMFNAVISSYLYKKFKNFVLVCLVCFSFTCIVIIPTAIFLEMSWVLTLILLITLCVSAGTITNSLTVQAPLFLQNKKTSSGFLAGILNGACYVGNALSTFVLGIIADNSNWNTIFILFFIICFISLIVCLIYYIISRKKHIICE